MSEVVISLSGASSLYMTGVIWLIQLIHYPAFHAIDEKEFSRFHHRHSQVMGWIVGPVMVVELLSTLWLAQTGQTIWIVKSVTVLFLWGLTFFVSVPCHNRLSAGKEAQQIDRLIRTNWPRTVLWTAAAAIGFLSRGY